MIKNKEQLIFFNSEDKKALGISKYSSFWKNIIYNDGEIYYYQRLLRRVEFLFSKEKTFLENILFRILYRKFNILSQRYGFTIPLNVFGSGLSIAHRGYIIVNPDAVIGTNCRIHPGTVIGEKDNKSPVIGDNVYIGPGAKIFGGVTIADGVRIGANAVVNKSVLKKGVTVVGIPARIIDAI